MGVLSDGDIRWELYGWRLKILPSDTSQIQPASFDLRLGDRFRCPMFTRDPINLWESAPPFEPEPITPVESYTLYPGRFVLAHTMETVTLPDDITGNLEGKSTLGRGGLIIHTAGRVDPGFSGQLTLELFNCAPYPIMLIPGQRICQIVLTRLTSPARDPYGSPNRKSKYQGQAGVTVGVPDANKSKGDC